MALVTLENLSYWYPGAARPALEGVNLVLREGEFVLVVGGSGSGKSTLLRLLAGLLGDFYGGKLTGRATFMGRNLLELDRRQVARHIGLVFQDPERQLVMTRVDREVAFGLENLGLPPDEIRRRVAEALELVGLASLGEAAVGELSGGQQQKVALAGVLAMHPRLLLLDEPTSQLDPIAAEEILHTVRRLNEEAGLTVVLVEHRLERCFHVADRVVALAAGRIVVDGSVQDAARVLARDGGAYLPPVARLFARLGWDVFPTSVREGRRLLSARLDGGIPVCVGGREVGGTARADRPMARETMRRPSGRPTEGDALLIARGVWFGYENGREALKGVDLAVRPREILMVLGPSGSGKSTLLKILAGQLDPDRGRVLLAGLPMSGLELRERVRWVGYVGQHPDHYLIQETLEEELRFTLRSLGLVDEGRITDTLEALGLAACRGANPRDLSSGERQRAAVATVLVARPRVLILDEPTRGIDYALKTSLSTLLRDLSRKEGSAVVVATHDVEFAALTADRVVLLADGRVVAQGPARDVLDGNLFYSTQINRLLRGYASGIVELEEALAFLRAVMDLAESGTPRGGA